ncbi:hypothetical protein ATE92_2228 [Ulvibacter sp. MAR_2010_11]|uniref:hypothetical protein n=1 Tax=Ulvibacter sp. MAR_2010_11 TaxID=1250229 RepID=UPI000C2C35BC|nr:hypothetical protein [Ulvibacter sp. MAR_2010_11]PKA84058.1 hypothetical protein ATE92_2228 [Ulvibacter sp. MAR_2010_11]
MKTKTTLLVAIIAVLFSCSPEHNESNMDSLVLDREGETSGDPVTLYQTDLMAGQNILMGYVRVDLVNGEIVVTYQSDGDWVIEETHLFIGELNQLPTNNGGNPKIGQFPYIGTHPAGTTTVAYTGQSMLTGQCVYVAAHAVVTNTISGQSETAWGAGVPIGGNSWAMMFEVCN